MTGEVTWWAEPPAEAPDGPLNPFDEVPPPLAMRAAEEVMTELAAAEAAGAGFTRGLRAPQGGKMFGVLVVRDPSGRYGYLKAFSGQLDGAWLVPGFVPPAFDLAERAEVEVPGEALVQQLNRRAENSERELEHPFARRDALRARHEAEAEAQRSLHRARRLERQRLRSSLAAEDHAALDQESRHDGAELRRAKLRWRTEAETLEQELSPRVRRHRALLRLRRLVCRTLQARIFDTYRILTSRGERVGLRALFGADLPPSGTGDCAGIKLLSRAHALELTPVALAELWWGSPPPAGARVQGHYYPACRDKCGPVIPELIERAKLANRRRLVFASAEKSPPRIIHRATRWLIVEKPENLLSVPGNDDPPSDSVLAWARRNFPTALLVHRLDAATSGLLLVALDLDTYRALQKQFAEHRVEKRYVAWLAGTVREDAGTIELPLRVDLAQRPRQIVDRVHGRHARTRFEVIERRDGRTRIHFFPETGRTHQLRAHAAHPEGLGCPIVGDRLYGAPADRLMLHAESLAFFDPEAQQRVSFECAAPF